MQAGNVGQVQYRDLRPVLVKAGGRAEPRLRGRPRRPASKPIRGTPGGEDPAPPPDATPSAPNSCP
eukprot:621378-Pyramimonas_sp.AAC.1